MKHLKILGIAAVAATALTAFPAFASATTLTHNGTAMQTSEALDFSVTKSLTFNTTGGSTIFTCTEGTMRGSITNAGGPGATVSVSLSTLTWVNCNTTVDTLAAGTLEVHNIAGSQNGTVTSSGSTFTVNVGGISCSYATNNTDIGTLVEGSPAKLIIIAVINKESGSFLCPTSAQWVGEYTNTEPSGTLAVDA